MKKNKIYSKIVLCFMLISSLIRPIYSFATNYVDTNTDIVTNWDEYKSDFSYLDEYKEYMDIELKNSENEAELSDEDVIKEYSSTLKAKSSLITTQKGKDLIVVIDPGHDSIHSGCSYFGQYEAEINLKIAKALENELNEYEGVKVYMTRTDNSCLNKNSNNLCLHARANFAASVNADIFISVHVNASDNEATNGSLIMISDNNYLSGAFELTKSLGSKILDKLSVLGLTRVTGNIAGERGYLLSYFTNPSIDTNEFLYPNGTNGNYYSVIRNNLKNSIPAIIIEHGYLSNYSDFSNYMSSDSKLAALGIADANGIAEYYNLQRKSLKPTISNAEVTNVTANGYTVKATVSSNTSYVAFPTWTQANGQDDITWERGVINGNIATYEVNTSTHNGESGTYITHIYAYNLDGIASAPYGTLTKVPELDTNSKAPISDAKVTNITSSGYTITATINDSVKSVYMPTWTEKNGQDDIIWYNAAISDNTVTLKIKTNSHNNESGTYITHIYAYDKNGVTYSPIGLVANVPASSDDTLQKPLSNAKVMNITSTGYTVTVSIDSSVVKSVYMPTWTEQDEQDDIIWHNANISGNTATFRVKTNTHNDETGTYNTHIYAYGENGQTYGPIGVSVTVPR